MREIGTSTGFCASSASVFQMVGKFLSIIKILIPVLLVVLGAMDILKAVISSDDKAIKAAQSLLIKRAIAAAAVFFAVTIVDTIMGLIGDNAEGSTTWSACWNNS